MEWKLAEAKNKLSELVTRVKTEGPQVIRWHDGAVVLIAESAYQALAVERPTFKNWILKGPRIDNL